MRPSNAKSGKNWKLPIVVISVIEYNSASVNVHRGKRSPIASVSPLFVAFIMLPSKRRNCSCTSIVQFRSYSTFKRSAKIELEKKKKKRQNKIDRTEEKKNRTQHKLVSYNKHDDDMGWWHHVQPCKVHWMPCNCRFKILSFACSFVLVNRSLRTTTA